MVLPNDHKEQELLGLEMDRDLWDFLEKQSGYTGRWVARKSTTGRGYRLHNTSRKPSYATAREAVMAAMVEEETT